jgi:hypothetical protein
MKYLAVYHDRGGNSFSAPLTMHDGRWMLATANGPQEVSFYIHGNDLAGGFATFQDFRLDDVPEGLRGCDFISLRKRMYETLPWPQKPATAPTPIPQSETRVHLEERLPGESRLAQLQRSFGAGFRQARLERQQIHQNQSAESANEAERRDAAKVAAARRLASDALHARQRPNYGASGQPEK